ncbi:exostosin-2-like [Penaeus chinensis]|uniref:exostosin-2-like n=1 Tax=Penaeus chinensis TaxID=139456 RepID=UPI001FB7BB73|nr:exostosin-2-like [Penaeus chinensis]
MKSMDLLVSRWKYRNFVISVVIVITVAFSLIGTLQLLSLGLSPIIHDGRLNLEASSHWQELVVGGEGTPDISKTRYDCHYFNCFNVYRCGRGGYQRISVYVYPMMRYVDEEHVAIKPMSKEFYEIIDAILNSEYYTSDPDEACIFIPPIDTLNENNLRKDEIAKALAMLPHWSEGENHLLFNMMPGTPPEFDTTLNLARGKAIVGGGGFSSLTYRRGYDVSLPVYNPAHQNTPMKRKPLGKRQWLMVSSQPNIHRDYREDLEAQLLEKHTYEKDLLILDKCVPFSNLTVRCRGSDMYQYPQILNDAKFCLVIRGGRLGQTTLYDAMQAGCVPIIIADSYVLPFSEVIDWKEAAVQIYEEDLPTLMQTIKTDISEKRLEEMHKQVLWLYEKYFSTMEAITLTTLKILNDRVFPAHARSLEQWNRRPIPTAVSNPLFLPITAPVNEGFTAVILTYDRLESLFQVIQTMVQVPSLSKVLVVWNNQKKPPPQASMWPKISVPLKVVQTRENKLSNRFYPYEEIETECILAIDDDINMMTADELEFGYQVWREFPDRIVGFPPRNVLWSNDTRSWKYDSEWTNEVSMVLTGVAFYHKYWSYVYTTQLPGNIKEWVDANMNCEDIAMNFLVSNLTGKAPIKVTPRKKFKCGECTSGDLSANEAHMVERSQCVSHFTHEFGTMPLKTVEFRADPVLYMDNFPEKLKLYNNMGSL